MNNAYILINKGKITIPVGSKYDPVAGLDKVFDGGIIPPAYQKDIFVQCTPASSMLSCDIARAIVSTIRFACPVRKLQVNQKAKKVVIFFGHSS